MRRYRIRLCEARPPEGERHVRTNSALMEHETRVERRLDRLIAHAESPRKAALVIALVTTLMTLLAGWLMTVIDDDGFPTLGSGLWWAVQTVTTVGYGDHVPATWPGQITAGIVMLVGIGFVTVITAAITSTFIARSRREEGSEGDGTPDPSEQLRQIDERLARIEAALHDRP